MIDLVKTLNRLANRHAGKLFLLGLAGVAAYNWRQWQRDRALLAHQEKREPLPPLEAWPELPLVSVLVAAWDEAGMIERHIESFLALRYPHKELILCAGGEDGTYEIAHRYAGEQVQVLKQRASEGKQRALRRCFERSSGDVIFLTDADCLLSEDAFESTLFPVVAEGEAIATGASCPVVRQRILPFVLQQWYGLVYARAHWKMYTDGILGRNAAIRREALDTVGAFQAEVRTGTDYYLAKELLGQGYAIRHMPASAIETACAETARHYQMQQTRWLRNVVMHGLRFGAYSEVVRCLIPSVIGVVMLSAPLSSLVVGRLSLVGWLLAWVHAYLSRVRYIRFGERVTGQRFPSRGFLLLPGYILTDFVIWASTLLQYPLQSWRSRW